jgi:hypothetical protein
MREKTGEVRAVEIVDGARIRDGQKVVALCSRDRKSATKRGPPEGDVNSVVVRPRARFAGRGKPHPPKARQLRGAARRAAARSRKSIEYAAAASITAAISASTGRATLTKSSFEPIHRLCEPMWTAISTGCGSTAKPMTIGEPDNPGWSHTNARRALPGPPSRARDDSCSAASRESAARD